MRTVLANDDVRSRFSSQASDAAQRRFIDALKSGEPAQSKFLYRRRSGESLFYAPLDQDTDVFFSISAPRQNESAIYLENVVPAEQNDFRRVGSFELAFLRLITPYLRSK